MSTDNNCNENKLTTEQKITLWKHYNDNINTIENRLTALTTMISAAFTILTAFLGDKNLIYVIPALAIIFLYYLSYQQRIVEILRGYLLYVEEDLLDKTNYNGLTWNSFGVMKNYNVNYFRAQLLSGPMYIIVMGLSCVFTFYKMFENGENIVFVILYIAICLFFCISFAFDLSDNNYVAITVKEKLIDGDLSNKPKLKRKPIKDIILFWHRR